MSLAQLTFAAVAAAAVGLSAGCTCPGAAGPGAAASPAAPAGGGGPATVPASGGGARAARQYLVTVVAGAGEAPVREAFAPFGVESVQRVSDDLYLLVVVQDPGPEKMEEARRGDARLRAVQPNFVYRAN